MAALEMDLLDYDFHLFTEKATGIATVLYRGGPRAIALLKWRPLQRVIWRRSSFPSPSARIGCRASPLAKPRSD